MLLLKTLKREYIDWKAVEEKHIPRRNCHGFCMSLRLKDEFSAVEWRNKADSHCKACVQRHLSHRRGLTVSAVHVWQIRFSRGQCIIDAAKLSSSNQWRQRVQR